MMDFTFNYMKYSNTVRYLLKIVLVSLCFDDLNKFSFKITVISQNSCRRVSIKIVARMSTAIIITKLITIIIL